MTPGPKAAADERRHNGDVERYEELRRHALGGEASGWRLGLALLQRRGVAAWARAWMETTPPVPAAPVPTFPVQTFPVAPATGGGDELVGVLATMALACVVSG